MTRKEAVKVFFDKVKEAYIEDQSRKGIRASGRSASSFREEATFDGGRLYGASYFLYQAVGRKPGKFPPLESIIQWIRDKGIQPKDISEKSLAFLIARKISKKGTDIHAGKRPGLNIDDKMQTIKDELSSNLLKGTRDEIMNKLKLTFR